MKVKLWTRLGGGSRVFLAEAHVPPFHHPPEVLVWRGRYFVPETSIGRGHAYVEVVGHVVEEKRDDRL